MRKDVYLCLMCRLLWNRPLMGNVPMIFIPVFKDRIVFLDGPIDDHTANVIIAQFLFLEAEDPDKDIHFYINSPGGVVTAGMAIYDTMQYIRPDVSTIVSVPAPPWRPYF